MRVPGVAVCVCVCVCVCVGVCVCVVKLRALQDQAAAGGEIRIVNAFVPL